MAFDRFLDEDTSPARTGSLEEEVRRLRELLRDLTAVTALPTLWVDKNPDFILESLVDTLLRTLRLEVVWVHVRTGPREVAQGGPASLGSAEEIRRALGVGASAQPIPQLTAFVTPDGEMIVHLARLQVPAADLLATVVAGATRDTFPSDHESFLLRTITNHAMLSLRQAQLLADLRRADEEKNDFIARLGHELRNPLGPILNGAELLDSTTKDPPTHERAVQMIRRQAEHMSRMMDNLLDVSRIARGAITLRTSRLDLVELARNAVDDRAETFLDRRIELRRNLSPTPVWVEGDATRLAQIIDNLLVNAGKFTNPGGWVEVGLQAEQPGEVTIQITDSGTGLAAEEIERVFEPFAQAPRRARHEAAGLGLGLSLARGLARLHGGDIAASSAGPGHGATFEIRLPVAAAPGDEQPEGERSVAARSSQQVILVEDNPDVAESLRLLLESLGHEVRVAATGIEALEAAREDRPDVLLCDIGLPAPIDGLALARELRSDSRTSGVRLIAVTGYGQDDDKLRSREAGFDLHLTKPVSLATLEEVFAPPIDAHGGPTTGRPTSIAQKGVT